MVQKRIMVFIEGEGGGGKPRKRDHNDGEFRKAWGQFLKPLNVYAFQKNVKGGFKCIPGGDGRSTADRFANPLPQDKGALRILLIDSEVPVNDASKPWSAIAHERPGWADDGNCYLMVQCLETWLLADIPSLQRHYDRDKKRFKTNKLKAWPDLEKIARQTLQKALEDATRDCSKRYSHADGNILIAVVDREQLKTLSSVARLFNDFQKKIDAYALEPHQDEY